MGANCPIWCRTRREPGRHGTSGANYPDFRARWRDNDARRCTVPKDSAFQAPLSFSLLLQPCRNVGCITRVF